MIEHFDERFEALINEKIPRVSLRSRVEENPHSLEKDLPEPDDGFVMKYCGDQS